MESSLLVLQARLWKVPSSVTVPMVGKHPLCMDKDIRGYRAVRPHFWKHCLAAELLL